MIDLIIISSSKLNSMALAASKGKKDSLSALACFLKFYKLLLKERFIEIVSIVIT